MNIEDYPAPVRPFAVAEKRIEAARLNADGLLFGVHYDREARLNVMGADKLPFIQPAEFTFTEAIFSGAARQGHADGNTPLIAEGNLSFFVSTRRDYGFIRRSMEDPLGTQDWLGRLQDAIERHTDGVVDSYLEKTVQKPVKFSVRETYITELSIVIILDISIFTARYWRGGKTEKTA